MEDDQTISFLFSIEKTSERGNEDGGSSRRMLTLCLCRHVDEYQLIDRIKAIADQNQVWRTFIGMGYYNCHVPHPILRNLFENPGW